MFSWRDSVDAGGGRATIWVHPHSDIAFKYYGHRMPSINGAWVDALMIEANKPGGLQISEEPGTHDGAPRAHRNPISASGRAIQREW